MSTDGKGYEDEGKDGVERKLETIYMLIRILLVQPPPITSLYPHYPTYPIHTTVCPYSLQPALYPIKQEEIEHRPYGLSFQSTVKSGVMTATLTPSRQSLPLLDSYYPNVPTFSSFLQTESKIGIKEQADSEYHKMSKDTEEPQAELLKRVLSSGSNASKGSKTPTKTSIPLSPPSVAGNRTPKAGRQGLQDGLMDVKPETPTALASDMDGLQVKSPVDQTAAPFTLASAMGPTPHGRSDSSSTEASEGFQQPLVFAGSYGPEGFPLSTNIMDDGHQMTPAELQMSAQAAAAIAAADEAIKQLNGTSSVIQGPPGVPNVDSPYSLPRGYANFVNPQARSDHRSPEFNVHRQSSTSSSMTEASTSSEESDLCIPGFEWVNVVSPAAGSNFGSPFSPALGQAAKQVKSPGRMPPPSSGRGLNSPRRAERPALPGHASSLPFGATAKSPSGLAVDSALPGDIDANASSTEDDDEQTVGNGRDRSSSSSSRSTGLDLLWAATQKPGTETTGPNTDSPYDQPYDSKGKRKAGAEAVAQWRASGIPIGETTEGGDDTMTVEQPQNGNGLPKKRRRSEIHMEEIDPALRDEDSAFADESTMGMEVEKASNPDSDSGESLDSIEDPEYKGDTPMRGRQTGVRSRATGASGKKGGKAGGKAAGGTAASNGLTPKAGGKKARKTDSPNRNGGGGGGGGAGGGSKKGGAAGPASANVQCEYVNPLPPYNRCQDVFTRKYDLPRHMARHARREGELVYEGKLSEDKALLWKTIKDKPKVTCNVCGESFTRMDALKRHQTKQHHQ